MATNTPPEVQGGPKILPVYFKQKDIMNYKEKPITTLEVCRAAEKSGGTGNIEGAQVIRGLWRIYCWTDEARQKLIEEKLSMRNTTVDIYDQNPFIKPPGENTYLAIHGIPVSYSNDAIKRWLETHGFPPVSPIKYQYARDENNKLTAFKTGSRFVYVDGNPDKIPETAQIGLFTAKLWHPGLNKKKATPKCSNCLQEGHTKADCQSPVVCFSCKQEGHKRGECPIEPEFQEEKASKTSAHEAIPAAFSSVEQRIKELLNPGIQPTVDDYIIQQIAALLTHGNQPLQQTAGPSGLRGTHSFYRGPPPPRGRGYPVYRHTDKIQTTNDKTTNALQHHMPYPAWGKKSGAQTTPVKQKCSKTQLPYPQIYLSQTQGKQPKC